MMTMRRIAAGLLSAGLLISFTPRARHIAAAPEEIVVPAGQEFVLARVLGEDGSGYLAAAARGDERLSAGGIDLALWGVPVRRVALTVAEQRTVVPGGHSIGVALRTQGVMVVGVSDVATESGTVCPARAADLRAGEAIVMLNGTPVNSVDEFTALLADGEGAPVELTISGEGGQRTVSVTPVLDPHDNRYRLGAWVRDSTAGVGTLSFYDPATGRYGALGHAICDVDTGNVLTVSEG